MRTSVARDAIGLACWLVASGIAAAIGAQASMNAPRFYGDLVQPAWAPPAWLFGPVWSVLFLAIGVSAWLVWQRHGFRGARSALLLFVAQLVANALWSWLFFAWHQGALAVAEIVVLWVLIAQTIWSFWRLHRLAAMLLVPYLAWVSFAAVLNVSLWQLNPGVLG